MSDDSVRMVPKAVFPVRRQLRTAMETHGEVGRKGRPDLGTAHALGAEGERAVFACFGEEEVDHVGDEKGPEQRDGAKEEEGGDGDAEGEGVVEDCEGL